MARRVVLAALSSLIVLVLAAGGAAYWFLSGDGVRRTLESEATAWLGEPVRIGAAAVTLFPRVALRLRDVQAGEPARLVLADVSVSAPLRALLAGRLRDAEVIVADSRVQMPLAFAPSGARDGTSQGASDRVAVLSIRTIGLRNVTVASRGRRIDVSADSFLAGTRLTLTRLTATAGPTRIDATGTIELSPRIDATIDAHASWLDLDDLLALVSAITTRTDDGASATAVGARVLANITADRGRLAGVELSRFDAIVRTDGGALTIEPFTFDVFGGRHQGWLEAQLGRTLQVRVGSSVSNIDVAQLAAFGGVPGIMTGRLAGSGRVGAQGPDIASVLASARGVGEVVITRGSLRGLEIVRSAVRFLAGSAGEDSSGGGAPVDERFDEIAATFAMADGTVHSEDLTLRSPDADVFARGALTLAGAAIDARADVVLSESLSAKAGRDLYRYARAGTRIVLPATLGGTLARPRVRIDAAAALRRGVSNEIEHRLRALFERPLLF